MEQRPSMIETRPWLVVPIILAAFIAVLLLTPVLAYFFNRWWDLWQ